MIKAYASYFASYLMNELGDLSNINKIILFGSAAREEATKESDVDIFIEANKKSKTFEEKIYKILENFYKSRESLLFKAKRIDNKINIILGKLDEFSSLKESIESYGIVLYGKYVSSSVKGRKQVIITWDNIGKNRGAFLNKLYGFKIKDKQYKGFVEIVGGSRLGKSGIMIPVEHRSEMFELIKKYKVSAKVFEAYV